MNEMSKNKTDSDSNFTKTKSLLAEMAAETGDLAHVAGGPIPDVAAGWLTPQYLLSLRDHLASQTEGPERFKLLRLAVGDVAALQRGCHTAARLQLERERFDRNLQKHRAALAAAQQEIQKLRDPNHPLSEAGRLALVTKANEILGLK